MDSYKSSYYNLRVPRDDGFLLFNGKTGALFHVDSGIARDLVSLLGPERDSKAGRGYSDWSPSIFAHSDLPNSLKEAWDSLLDGGIFVNADFDERSRLKEEYKSGMEKGPFWVTVTTTLDCNMRCYYCYQKDDEMEHMSLDTCDSIIEWLKGRISQNNFPRLYLDWYGGEPMLNQPVIERISKEIIPYCDDHGVIYKGSMICNGTNWPEDVHGFLDATRIYRVQFTLDGPEKFHNKRRGIIASQKSPHREKSYDEVMKTVSSVIEKAIVYLRINVDPNIGSGCLELIDEFRERGWFDPKYRFYPYVAVINPMTEHCGFIGESEKFKAFKEEFVQIKKKFAEKLTEYSHGGKVFEKIMYYPNRRIINCAAVNKNSAIFGPNGLMYKCGLDVGDNFRAHDAVGQGEELFSNLETKLDSERWNKYDPFTHSRCKECQYLPVCLGGCPRTHMEGEEEKIKASSEFFEQSFGHMVQQYYESMDRL